MDNSKFLDRLRELCDCADADVAYEARKTLGAFEHGDLPPRVMRSYVCDLSHALKAEILRREAAKSRV